MKIAEFKQASSANYTKGRGGHKIDGMAVHYTATSASAHNNLVYFSRAGANASAHLFVDKDGTIRQSVKFEDTAWAVGNWGQNQRTVSVEVVSAGEDFTAAQINALKSIYQYLKATYGITRVIRHYDVTGKRCPAPYVDGNKWAKLKAQITGGAAVSGGSSKPSGGAGLKVDGWWGPDTTRAVQRALGTTVDGIVSGQYSGDFNRVNEGGLQKDTWKIGKGGSDMVAAIQRKVGVNADRYFGVKTCKALQRYLGTEQDGTVSAPSQMVKELQRRLNAGTF